MHAREMHMYEVNVPMMRDYIYGSADNVDWFMKHWRQIRRHPHDAMGRSDLACDR